MIYFFQSLSLKTRFLGVLLLLFPVLVFWWLLTSAPWAMAHLQILAQGVGTPDQRWSYTPQELYQIFTAWGERGRWHYVTVLWPSDLGFLISYSLFLTVATLYWLKKANPAHSWWYLVALLPLAGGSLDFLENLFVVVASFLPLEGWEPLAGVVSTLTTAKWCVLGLAGAVLVVGTLAVLVRLALARIRSLLQQD